MTTYDRPDVYVGEKPSLDTPIKATATGLGCLIGVTASGPLRKVIRTTTFEAWKKIYGDRMAVGFDMAYEAEAFFKEGGRELLTSRIAHYTDVDDNTTYAGSAALRTIVTDPVQATSAEKTCTTPAPTYNFEPGWHLDLDVDNVGVAVATWDAARAVIAGGAPALPPDAGDTVVFKCDRDPDNQTVTFAGTENTVALAIAALYAQTDGIEFTDNAGSIDLRSPTYGTDSSIRVVSETGASGGASHIGHTPGAAVIGTGDVGDIDAVTAQEIKDIIEADTTATVDITSGTPVISSPTTGVTSELDFDVASTAALLAALGLAVEVITGTATGATFNTLRLQAGYMGSISPGTEGNKRYAKVVQNPVRASLGAGLDIGVNITIGDVTFNALNIKGVNIGSVLKVWEGTTIEYVQVREVSSAIVAGSVTHTVTVETAFSNSFNAANARFQSQEFDLYIYNNTTLVETWTSLSMLDTADNYVETIINDEDIGSEWVVATDLDAVIGLGADLPATDSDKVALAGGTSEITALATTDWIGGSVGKTGLYALDTEREFMPFGFVGQNGAVPVLAGLQYAESRIFLEFIGYVTAGMTAAQAIGYREGTLGANSKYGSLYAGGIKVYDPLGSGKNPKRSIRGVGALMGLRSRVDNLPDPNGGPWQAPAGEADYGRLKSALDIVDEYNDSEHGLLNAAGINVIRKFGKTSPVLVWGARTLDDSVAKKWRYINVLRFFQFVEKSVADSTRWAVFRNNDFRLWSTLKDRVDKFLESLMPKRAFPAQKKADCYYIKSGVTDGVMTQADIDDGKVISEIGLAPQKPGEFVQFWFTQYEGGTSIEE